MIFLSTLLISMLITISLIPLLAKLAVRVRAIDFPNDRKVHLHPMPKSGGLAMAIGSVLPVFLWAPVSDFARSVFIGAGIIVFFGMLDDYKGLGYKSKFASQAITAAIVIFFGGLKIKNLGLLLPDGVLLSDWLAIPLTLIVIVGVTNAINLSDGLDGLAGGLSLLTFVCIGYLAYRCDNMFVSVFSVAISGAIFGFLRFNTYPASVFMGDTGSQLLGFLAVTLSLGLTQENAPLSPLLPLILLGFPVLDTLTVMTERIGEGRSPFLPDNKHFHHRLIRLGLFHTEAVLVIYVLQAFLVTFAFIFRFYSEWFLLIFYLIFSGIILFGFLLADRTGWQFRRYDIVDRVIKGRLRLFKEKGILIKISFKIVQICLPLLLLFTCFLSRDVPGYVSLFSTALILVWLGIWQFRKDWLGHVMGVSLYLFIPFVLYFSQADMVGWMKANFTLSYNLSFGFLAFFVILTLKFTRRKKGFEITPMHFLILLVALVVPRLPDESIQGQHMGLLAAKIIVLFFSYEILMGELRGRLNMLWLATIPALIVMSVRGLTG